MSASPKGCRGRFPSDENSYRKQCGFYTAGYTREMKDVPIMFVSGWFDYFVKGTIRTYVETAGITSNQRS